MSKKKSTFEKNLVASGVVVIIGVLVIYYFISYVPGNEEDLRKLGVRTIQTISSNCREKFDSYETALTSSKINYLAKWLLLKYPDNSIACSGNGLEVKPGSPEDANEDLKIRQFGIPSLVPDTQPQNKHQDFHFRISGVDDDPVLFRVDISTFMENLKHFDFFDDIFLLEAGGKKDEKPQVLDVSRLGLLHFSIPDSISLKGVAIYKDELSGETYWVYHQRLKLGDKEYSLVGLISKASYDQRARQVPNWLFIFVILGLLLVLQLWPILKLFLVSKQERIKSVDVQLTTFSIVFSVGFVTVLIGAIYTFYGPQKSEMQEALRTLSRKMAVQLTEDIDTRRKMIDQSEGNMFLKYHNEDFLQQNIEFSYNEIFSASVDGDDKINGKINALYVETSRDYPQLRCADDISVATRHYFYVPAEALMKKVSAGMFLQSVISRSSGDLEGVVSLPDTCANEVRVITSYWPSVIHPVLPAGYSFVIVDKEGGVQFHSDTRKVKNENLFSEIGNSNTMRSFVRNGSSGYLDFFYEGREYDAFFRPLQNDWHLVVMYNWEATRNFAASVFMLCLSSILAMLLYIIFLHILFKLDKPNYSILKFRPFFFQWLNPLMIPAGKLRFLIFVLTGLAVADLLWLVMGRSITGTFFWYLLTITICYTVVYRTLRLREKNTSESDRPNLKNLPGLFEWCAMLLIICLAFLFVVNGYHSSAGLTLPVLLTMALLLSSTWAYFRGAVADTSAPDSGQGYWRYKLFLMLCLLNLAILPAANFFRDHFQHENIIRTRAMLQTEIRQRQITSATRQHDINTGKIPTDYIQQPGESPDDSILRVAAFDQWMNNKYDQKDSALQKLYPLSYFGTWDNYLYNRMEKYFGQDQIIHQGLITKRPYNLDSIFFWHTDDVVIAHAPKTLITRCEKEQWSHWGKMLCPTFLSDDNGTLIFVFAGMLIFAGLLWRALFEIPNKVFYLPLHYDALNPSQTVDAFPPVARAKPITESMSTYVVSKFERLCSCNEGLAYDIKTTAGKRIYETRVIQLQENCGNVFKEIWGLCTQDEKNFLYDLAEDGIVNQGDRKIMKQLVQKGILRTTPRLEIISPALTNYILESMTEDELYEMEQSARKEGRWNSWRFPLMILILAILGFLSLVQEDFMTRIGALIASVGFILPQLINIGSAFGKLIPRKNQSGG